MLGLTSPVSAVILYPNITSELIPRDLFGPIYWLKLQFSTLAAGEPEKATTV